MTAATLSAEAYAQVWQRKAVRQHLLSSPWDIFSNRVAVSDVIPKEGRTQIPTTIVHKVSGEFRVGDQRITVLWSSTPFMKPVAGPNKAEGKERKITTKTKRINYNIQRFPMAAVDASVEGDSTEYYNLAGEVADRISDLFVMTTDYDHERALCEGADEWLTDSAYWEDSEYGTNNLTTPVNRTMHPNAYITGLSGKQTWNLTYATAVATIVAGLTSLAATDNFDLADLDRCYLIASRTIDPAGNVNGKKYKWVLLLSDAQWNDLTTAVAAGSFRDLLKYTEKGFERMYEGNIGVYKDMLIVASQRSPIFSLNAADAQGVAITNANRFCYARPDADSRLRLTKTAPAAADGTYEIAKVLGAGCVGLAEIKDTRFISKGFDYDFSKGITGERSRGTERMDFDTDSKTATAARINESSFLFYTATSAATA